MTVIDYDLEFLEDGRHIELISIGMVCDDGREYYAVNRDMPVRKIRKHKWLMENVVPHLPKAHGDERNYQIGLLFNPYDRRVKHKAQIADDVMDFIRAAGPDVQLWANYGAYDHVALAQLWGRMIDLPEGVPMFTCDIQQERARLGLRWDELPQQESGEHNALADARHNQFVRRWLAGQEARTS
ncbi:3'-5' exoribonuclease domain-containing protein [Streptomyces collinus]|uniref:3'-5' exoribonuclease domain-containing protein n=1 Tax=Streptomyces collinus TaxID=42684 RepID=UPI00381F3E40